MPSFEEYMNNSVVTSCIYVMFLALIPGLKSVTKEDIDWLLSEPKLVISTAKMGRHLEDLGSHEVKTKNNDLNIKSHSVFGQNPTVRLLN